jgi:methyl-accepting chemotaxis protein
LIARPIAGMTEVMTRLSSGDKDVAVPDSERRDEIGQMAQAVSVFKEGMIRADRLAADQAGAQRGEGSPRTAAGVERVQIRSEHQRSGPGRFRRDRAIAVVGALDVGNGR